MISGRTQEDKISSSRSSVSSNEELGPSSVASRIAQIGDRIPVRVMKHLLELTFLIISREGREVVMPQQRKGLELVKRLAENRTLTSHRFLTLSWY